MVPMWWDIAVFTSRFILFCTATTVALAYPVFMGIFWGGGGVIFALGSYITAALVVLYYNRKWGNLA